MSSENLLNFYRFFLTIMKMQLFLLTDFSEIYVQKILV